MEEGQGARKSDKTSGKHRTCKSEEIAATMARENKGKGAVTPGRNMFGTCFGETGLKIRPDVFCHDNGEQKKHVLLCKMSPASHFFLFEKGEKNNK